MPRTTVWRALQWTLLLLALRFLAPGALRAAPQLTLEGAVRAEAQTPYGTNIDSDSTRLTAGSVAGIVSASLSAEKTGSVAGRDTGAFATFEGTAEFGTLRGSAYGEALGGLAWSQLFLTWQDEFRPISHGLAWGTPVDFRFTMTLDSMISATSDCDGVSPPGPAIASLSGTAGIISDRACPGPPGQRSLSTILTVPVGLWAPLEATLSLGVSVSSNWRTMIQESALVDASHTARFYLDPIGSDYSYQAASGRTYFSPIPEPGTALLLGLGLAIAGARPRGPGARGR